TWSPSHGSGTDSTRRAELLEKRNRERLVTMSRRSRRHAARWTLAVVCCAVVAGPLSRGGIGASQQGGGRDGSPDNPARVLSGAIDIHVHSFPDNVERSV